MKRLSVKLLTPILGWVFVNSAVQAFGANALGFKVVEDIPPLFGVEINWDVHTRGEDSTTTRGFATLTGNREEAAKQLASRINTTVGSNIATATGDTVVVKETYGGVSFNPDFTTDDYFKLVYAADQLQGNLNFGPGLNDETFLTSPGNYTVEAPGIAVTVSADTGTSIEDLGFLLWQALPPSMFTYEGGGRVDFNIPTAGVLSFTGSGGGVDLILSSSVPETDITLMLLAPSFAALALFSKGRKVA